jgi:hypothetical protein
MKRDKQLREVNLDHAVEKRRLDQALNAKEFAVLAGLSYSVARAWFRRPGFPVVCGVVFWQDFVEWRRLQAGLVGCKTQAAPPPCGEADQPPKSASGFPARAAQILAEAG